MANLPNLTLLATQAVPAVAVPGPVELTFTTTAWTPTQQVDVSYAILQAPNVSLSDASLSDVAVPDRATPVKLQTRFQLQQGSAPQIFRVQAQVFDHQVHQFDVTWVITVKP